MVLKTKSFKDKLDEGEYGTIFKETFWSSRFVAVKVLDKLKTYEYNFEQNCDYWKTLQS